IFAWISKSELDKSDSYLAPPPATRRDYLSRCSWHSQLPSRNGTARSDRDEGSPEEGRRRAGLPLKPLLRYLCDRRAPDEEAHGDFQQAEEPLWRRRAAGAGHRHLSVRAA